MQSHHSPEMAAGDDGGGGGFTALLGLPPSQAMELLLPASNPTFPSDPALVDRAARFSAFATSDTLAPPPPPPHPSSTSPQTPPLKRKGTIPTPGNNKAAKKARSATAAAVAAENGPDEKPAYVHVRARRGQATDSHSLAERARREKINARMELLKELVPGCSKVSGTALVLDEIINHVQSLQRQVEYLSMRLAAVNPRIDYSGLDSFLAAECGRVTGMNGKNGVDLDQTTWPEMGVHGARQLMQQQQQFWHGDLLQQHHLPSFWERRGDLQPQVLVNPSASLFGYDLASSAPSHLNKLKAETEL